jgi:hypothetical protein
MVLDVSGSMREPLKYPLLRHALRTMLASVDDRCSVTVILFSSEVHLLREALPAPRARMDAAVVASEMDWSPVLFQDTFLAGALDLAIGAVERFRARQPHAVQRIYILTDGQIHDEPAACLRTAALEGLNVEINSYGFGLDFALASVRRILGCAIGGQVKQIRDPHDIAETFRHVLNVTARVIATDVGLQLHFADGVIPGDFFCHRPSHRRWPCHAFRPSSAPVFELGNLEAGRTYEWALEARLPEDVGPGFVLGDLELRYRVGEQLRTQTWPLAPSIEGTGLGPVEPDVRRAFQALDVFRDASPEALIRSFEARIEIARLEGASASYIAAMEQVKDSLSQGSSLDELDSRLVNEASADISTCAGACRLPPEVKDYLERRARLDEQNARLVAEATVDVSTRTGPMWWQSEVVP